MTAIIGPVNKKYKYWVKIIFTYTTCVCRERIYKLCGASGYHLDNIRKHKINDHYIPNCDSVEEAELKYVKYKKDLLDKYNTFGYKAYEIVGEHYTELHEDNIDYEIKRVYDGIKITVTTPEGLEVLPDIFELNLCSQCYDYIHTLTLRSHRDKITIPLKSHYRCLDSNCIIK